MRASICKLCEHAHSPYAGPVWCLHPSIGGCQMAGFEFGKVANPDQRCPHYKPGVVGSLLSLVRLHPQRKG